MSQHKLGRKEIRQPDAFQSTVSKAFEKIKPHTRSIALALTAIAFAAAAAWAFNLQSSKKLETLNADLAAAIADYEKNIQAKLTGTPTDWQATMTQLDALYEKTRGSELEAIVLHYIANTYIEMGNFDAALGSLGDLEKKAEKRPEFLVFAKYAKAKTLELKGDRQSALSAYEDAANVSPNPLGEFLEQEAKRANLPMLPKATLDQFLATKSVSAETDAK